MKQIPSLREKNYVNEVCSLVNRVSSNMGMILAPHVLPTFVKHSYG